MIWVQGKQMSHFLLWGNCTGFFKSTGHTSFSSSVFHWIKLGALCLMTWSVWYRQLSIPSFSWHFLCKYCSCHHLPGQYYNGINLKHNLLPFSLSRKDQFCDLNVRCNFTEDACRAVIPHREDNYKVRRSLRTFWLGNRFCTIKWYLIFTIWILSEMM